MQNIPHTAHYQNIVRDFKSYLLIGLVAGFDWFDNGLLGMLIFI